MRNEDQRDAGRSSEQPEPGATIGREPADTVNPTDGNGDPLSVDQPDEGWEHWPEGHRQGPRADDDQVRRKG